MFIVSISYQNVNKRTGGNRNGDEHYITLPTHTYIYIYTLLDQTSKGTVHGQVRDCTSASPICRLLWHSSSSLTPLFPPPFSFTKTPPLLTSSSASVPASSSPPLRVLLSPPLPPFAPALSRQHERRACAYPFLEQTLPVPFSPRPDFASTRKLFTFSSPPPSLLCHGCERVTYSVWKQPAKDFPGWVSRGTSYGGVG